MEREALRSHRLFQQHRNLGRRIRHPDAGGFEGGHLLRRRARAAGDDRAGVAHPLAWRRGLAGDEADHGLVTCALMKRGRFFLVRAADLADHHDRVGLRVGLEERQDIDERRCR